MLRCTVSPQRLTCNESPQTCLAWPQQSALTQLLWCQVADLQVNLKAEVEIVEEKKARTQALIESIGQEKATVDEAVESSRADEEDAAKLQVSLFGKETNTVCQDARPDCSMVALVWGCLSTGGLDSQDLRGG